MLDQIRQEIESDPYYRQNFSNDGQRFVAGTYAGFCVAMMWRRATTSPTARTTSRSTR
jgi:hypothetical protein